MGGESFLQGGEDDRQNGGPEYCTVERQQYPSEGERDEEQKSQEDFAFERIVLHGRSDS